MKGGSGVSRVVDTPPGGCRSTCPAFGLIPGRPSMAADSCRGTPAMLAEQALSDHSAIPAVRPGPHYYDEDVVRAFVIATVFWGIVGFSMGLFIASQLAWPALNLDLEWT